MVRLFFGENLVKQIEKNYLIKWFSSLFAVLYISVGLSRYYPEVLEMLAWPLHTHDIEIKVIESTIDWQYYIDKLDADLEKGFLYIDTTIKEEIIIEEPVIEEPDSLMIKLGRYIND